MIIVETPIVYARLGQKEPVVLECLIEAYPQGVHFWEHNRGKNNKNTLHIANHFIE